ncbi:MAG: hypothetical protein HC840_14415 [Leptolyngbyaceae cyanobacterium RM2_2_4]|nr:hypothetical protein [Leptolyngbyaceae cyanobacterium SL_5_14]NJO50428.1 hypothetical protein [Leptolyngbyaceae cyanobacterium RM2_2_4]
MLQNTKTYQNFSTKGFEAILEQFEVEIKTGMDQTYFQQKIMTFSNPQIFPQMVLVV